MGDETDQAVKILISFGLDDAAAREAVTRMDELKVSTNTTAAETKNLDDKSVDYTETAGNLGNAVQGLHISHRALHQILHLLGHETVPQLGRALSGLRFGPMVGTVLAAGFAYQFLHEKMKKWNEEMDETLKRLADPTFAAGMEAQKTSMEQAAIAADSYAKKLATTVESETTIADELERQLRLMNAIAEAKAKASGAKFDAKGAGIDADEAGGEITPEVADERRAALKADKAKAEREAKRQQDADEMTAKESALKELSEQQPDAEFDAETSRAEYEKEKARRLKTAKDFGDEKYNSKLEELKPEAEKAEKRKDDAEEWVKTIGAERIQMTTAAIGETAGKELQEKYKKYILDESFDYRRIEQEKKNLRTGNIQFKDDQESGRDFIARGNEIKKAEEAANKNHEEILKLTTEIEELKKKRSATDDPQAGRDFATKRFKDYVEKHRDDAGFNEEAKRAQFKKTMDSGGFDNSIQMEIDAAEKQKAIAEYRKTTNEGNKKFTDAETDAEKKGDVTALKAALKAAQNHAKELVKAALEAQANGHAELVGVIQQALKDLGAANAKAQKKLPPSAYPTNP